ncbi:MAG: hypothetical protein J1F35_01100 [Erysipelotrichales bacterium]|nr:hypothetical protein [Erysipelotrichales bacterium]
MAVKTVALDEYIKRQHDVFNAYISSNGKESSVLPFVSEYSKSDEIEYTPENIINYLNSYIKSKQISNQEVKQYNQTRLIPNDIIFKRGRIITEMLIENQGSKEILPRYQAYFAKKDGKLQPYSESYILKCRDYYLEHTKNQAILFAYQNVEELATRGKYDIELITKVLAIKDNTQALDFLNRINISKVSFGNLVTEYQTLYPADLGNLARLRFLYDNLHNQISKVVKFVNVKEHKETLEYRLLSLRRILEEYLMSDIENISELFTKHNFNEYKFNELLKDAELSKDRILHGLINKYNAKKASVNNSYKSILDLIIKAKRNGINYGYGYRELNIYDYYTIKNGISSKTLLDYAKNVYDVDTYNEVKDIIDNFNQDDISNTKEELLNSISNKNNKTTLIIDYLEFASLPLTIEMYEGVLERNQNKDISFEIEVKSKAVNI